MPEPPSPSAIVSPRRPEVGQLLPERLGVADRVVLDLAHDGERCVLFAHPTHGLAQHVLFVGEVEIHRSLGYGRQASARRVHGLSSASTGTATCAVHAVATVSPTCQREIEIDPAATDFVGADLAHRRAQFHRVAREDRALHAERHPSEPALGPGPVGDVPFEPRRLVRGVQEDVARAVALGGEVVVVVHRPPVACRDRAEHDGGGGDVVAQRRQSVPSRTVVQE